MLNREIGISGKICEPKQHLILIEELLLKNLVRNQIEIKNFIPEQRKI